MQAPETPRAGLYLRKASSAMVPYLDVTFWDPYDPYGSSGHPVERQLPLRIFAAGLFDPFGELKEILDLKSLQLPGEFPALPIDP